MAAKGEQETQISGENSGEKTRRIIKVTSPKRPRIDPETVAKALGARIVPSDEIPDFLRRLGIPVGGGTITKDSSDSVEKGKKS